MRRGSNCGREVSDRRRREEGDVRQVWDRNVMIEIGG